MGQNRVLQKLNDMRFLLIIVAIMVFVLTFGDFLPDPLKSLASSISGAIRAVLVFLLPFLIFPYMVSSILMLKSKGPLLLLILVTLIFCSNFLAILVAYLIGDVTLHHLIVGTTFNPGDAERLPSLFELELPKLITIEWVLFLGISFGFILSYKHMPAVEDFIEKYRRLSTLFLHKVFIPILPVYIFGTLLKIDYENDFLTVFKDFGNILIVIFCTIVTYIGFLFLVGSRFRVGRAIESIKNAFPAGLFGFSTLSSIVTMPVTLKAAEKNTGDKVVARFAITTTVNSHVMGDCLSIPLLVLTIYFMSHGFTLPDFTTYLYFAAMLALAQFTAVSVPGGSLVIMIPFAMSHLGFTNEMIGLLTALSIFIEPLGTSGNVMGNSAFAMIIHAIYKRLPNSRGG